MSVRMLEDIRTLDLATCSRGDVLVYCESARECSPVPSLPWVVARVQSAGKRVVVARFGRRADAICFTLAYCSSGWPDNAAPRVLVVVDGGMAHTYATPGVWVATADLDSQRQASAEELAPIHSDFGDLLEHACIDWPISPQGRRQSATVVTQTRPQMEWIAANDACLPI